uniref:Uncharacterized protein n=1 Tax=Aegilops tauschii subsp. strangulata TaxID=200361 RepID=A0A453JLC5_AEGTS
MGSSQSSQVHATLGSNTKCLVCTEPNDLKIRSEISAGVAVGSGWQVIVAYVNVGAYYIIGLPIGCVLGFKTSLGAAVSQLASHANFVFS